MTNGIVIIGAGSSGSQVAVGLRRHGYAGPITLIGDEPEPPYQRPPLSKSYLNGTVTREEVTLWSEGDFAVHIITLLTSFRATNIDRVGKRVLLQGAKSIGYDKLVLATGGRNRKLSSLEHAAFGLHDIRTLADADRFRNALSSARDLVIVGGGFIGLEAASIAAERGLSVTLIEASPRLMCRTASQAVSDYFLKLHTSLGTRIWPNTAVEEISTTPDGRRKVLTTDGGTHSADAILVSIGTAANDEIAQSAQIATDQGVLIDETLATSDQNIYAIGDCAKFHSPYCSAPMRIESVQNSNDQANQLASAPTTGVPARYKALPWFWTDQGRAKLQIAGIVPREAQQVIRGDVTTGAFSVYSIVDGRLAAVESINSPADHITARRLITKGVKPTAAQIQDPELNLKTLL
jgi:3-phenylpropionate/trans-cinnamate dioxygenase ferredoxin reductase subunit